MKPAHRTIPLRSLAGRVPSGAVVACDFPQRFLIDADEEYDRNDPTFMRSTGID